MRFGMHSLHLLAAVALLFVGSAAWGEEKPAGYSDGEVGVTQTALPALATSWSVGYSKIGSVPCNAWVPVHLWLANNTENILEATWRVRLKDYRESTYTVDYAMPVQIAGHGTQKHFIMHVYLPPGRNILGYYDIEPETWLESQNGLPLRPRNNLALNVILRQITKTVKQEDGETKEVSLYKDIFLWLGKDGSPPPLESQLAPNQRRALIAGQPEYLPRRWCAYAGFNAVIWDGGDLTRWEETARQTLLDYVAAGGHLVVAAGGNASQLRASFLAPLLPAAIEDSGERDAAEIFSAPGAGASRLAFCRLLPRPNSLVLKPAVEDPKGWRWSTETAEAPLAVRGDYGAGTVTLLAIPLQTPLAYVMPRQPATPLAGLWYRWLESVLHRPCETLLEQGSERLRTLAHKYLMAAASKPIPSRSRILAFLLVYLLASVPLLYLLARGFGRTEAAWLLLPFIACAFFGINYLYAFQHLKKDLAMTDLSLIRLGSGNRPEMAGGTTFSLAHNPTYRFYCLDFSAPQVTPLYLRISRLPSLADETLDFGIRLRELAGRVQLEDFAVPFNEERPLESMHVLPLARGLTLRLAPAFVASGDAPSDGVVGEADNGLEQPLFHAALLRGSKGWRLQPILAKTGAAVRLAEENPLPLDSIFTHLADRFGRKQLAMFLPLAVGAVAEGESRMALLAILSRQSILPWRVDGSPADAMGTTICCFLLPYAAEPLHILGGHLLPDGDNSNRE